MLLNLYDQNGILIESVNMDSQDIIIFLNKLFAGLKYNLDNAAKATNKVLQDIKNCGNAVIRNPIFNNKIEIIGD